MGGNTENVESSESFHEFESKAWKNDEDTVGWGEWEEYDGGGYTSIVLQKQVVMELAEKLEEESHCAEFKPVRVSIPKVDSTVHGKEQPQLLVIEIPYSDEVVVCAEWMGDYEKFTINHEYNE